MSPPAFPWLGLTCFALITWLSSSESLRDELADRVEVVVEVSKRALLISSGAPEKGQIFPEL